MTDQLTSNSQSVNVRDMSWEEIRKAIRVRGSEIGHLARNGDQTALALEVAYRYLYDHPGDQKAGANLRAALADYINRDLRIAEVAELGGRLGHRLPEPEKDPGMRIFTSPTRTQ